MEELYTYVLDLELQTPMSFVVRRVEQWRMKIVVWDRFCTNIGVLRILLLLAN